MDAGTGFDDHAPAIARAKTALAPLLFLIAVIAAYHNSLGGAFVLDDFATITQNPSIRQLWPLTGPLVPPNAAGVGGRPLANLTFAFSYAMGDLAVQPYHAFNLALHLAAALALFGCVRRTLRQPGCIYVSCGDTTPVAFVAAWLWLAHPLNTAVVDYLSQRTEALMACAYLFTLYAVARVADAERAQDRAGTMRWSIVAVLVCAAGMACKEVMITAPVIALLYDRTFLAGSWREAWRRRRGLYLGLATTWLVVGSLMITSHVGDRGVGSGHGVSIGRYLLAESVALVRYLRLAVWPQPLVFDHGWAFPAAGSSLFHVVAIIGLASVTAIALVRWPVVGFIGACFFVILGPTSVVPVVQQPVAESRMYLPLAGLIVAAAVAAYRCFGRAMLYAGATLALAATAATLHRNDDYRTAVALWSDTVAKAPANARAHCNLGAAFFAEGREAEAVREFRTALELRPDYAQAHNNLAAWLMRVDRPAEALEHLDEALRLDPELIEAYYNRGHVLVQLHRRNEAIAAFELTLQREPRHVGAHSDLGVVLLEAGETASALRHEEAALAIDPAFAPAHYNLANALVAAGRLREAVAHYHRALQLDPRFAKAEHNLAVALLRLGDRPGAIEHFQAALRVNPGYTEARHNLELVRRQGP